MLLSQLNYVPPSYFFESFCFQISSFLTGQPFTDLLEKRDCFLVVFITYKFLGLMMLLGDGCVLLLACVVMHSSLLLFSYKIPPLFYCSVHQNCTQRLKVSTVLEVLKFSFQFSSFLYGSGCFSWSLLLCCCYCWSYCCCCCYYSCHSCLLWSLVALKLLPQRIHSMCNWQL